MSERWLYGWGLGSVALGGASLVVPLYVIALGGGPFVLGVLAAVAALVGVPGALGAGRLVDRTGNYRGLLGGALTLVAGAIAVIPFLESLTAVIVANGVIWFAFAAATPVVTMLVVVDASAEVWSEKIALLNKYQGVGWAAGLLVGALWTGLGTQLVAPALVIRSLFAPLALAAVVGLVLVYRVLSVEPPAEREISSDRLRRALQRANRFSVRSATFPFTVGRADFREFHPRWFVDRFTPTLAVYFLAIGLCFAGFSAFFAPLPAFLAEVGFGSDGIFALYLINSLGAAVFFGPAGRLTAKLGAEELQILGLGGRGGAFPLIALVGLALGSTALGFVAIAAVFALIGITWAIIAVTAGTLVTELAPVAIRGEALGMYAALGALAGGVGSVLGGWLAAGSYLVAFGAAGGLVFAGAALVVVVRQRTAVDRRTTQPAA